MAYIKLEDLQRYPIRAYHYDKEHGNVNFINGVEAVLEYAEQLPKADVVEVVRCKDCRHSEICPDAVLWCNENNRLISGEAFCSYGERKEQNNG